MHSGYKEYFQLSTALFGGWEELTAEERLELIRAIKAILNNLEHEAGQEVHGDKVDEILDNLFRNDIKPEGSNEIY